MWVRKSTLIQSCIPEQVPRLLVYTCQKLNILSEEKERKLNAM